LYYFPILTIAPTYFDRHRSFAMGCILSGSGIGRLVMAPVLQVLLDRCGFRRALCILALWNFVVRITVAYVIRRRSGFGTTPRTRLNMVLVSSPQYVVEVLRKALCRRVSFIRGPARPDHSLTDDLRDCCSLSTGSLLLAINSGVNSISRIGTGVLADGVGRQNTMICSTILSALSVFALWYHVARERFIVSVIMYGIYAGGYNALLPTTITEIYGVENYARVNGSIYFIRRPGSLLGAPIAGLILGSYKREGSGQGVMREMLQERYNHVVVYSDLLLLCAGMYVACVRWLDARDKGVSLMNRRCCDLLFSLAP
ncbi:major facilitator superfamily domain-containing protein, partial [Mycena albidolilacea]